MLFRLRGAALAKPSIASALGEADARRPLVPVAEPRSDS
jgi:hypothetical protein